jgi:hypothetical protein
MVAARVVLWLLGHMSGLQGLLELILAWFAHWTSFMQVKLILSYSSLLTFLFSLISRGIRTGRLNVIKGLKRTNQIVDFGRNRHIIGL